MKKTGVGGSLPQGVEWVSIEDAAAIAGRSSNCHFSVAMLLDSVASGALKLALRAVDAIATPWSNSEDLESIRPARFSSPPMDAASSSGSLAAQFWRAPPPAFDDKTLEALNAQRARAATLRANELPTIRLSGVLDLDLSEGGAHLVEKLRRITAGEAHHQPLKWLIEPFRIKVITEEGHAYALLAPAEIDIDGLGRATIDGRYAFASVFDWPVKFTAIEVGVRSGELERYVGELGLPHMKPAQLATKPVPRAQAQRNAILAKLKELGFDTLALPPYPPGGDSPAKRAVREALGYSKDVMKKAWQSLRDDGLIKDTPYRTHRPPP